MSAIGTGATSDGWILVAYNYESKRQYNYFHLSYSIVVLQVYFSTQYSVATAIFKAGFA